MPPKQQMNVRLDSLTVEAIKRMAEKYNMTEGQVITRAVMLLEQDLDRPIAERKTRMLAVEIKLETGTYYIPLSTFDHDKVLIPENNGAHVLSPADIRANWDAWVADLVDEGQLLTAEELTERYPDIAIDRE